MHRPAEFFNEKSLDKAQWDLRVDGPQSAANDKTSLGSFAEAYFYIPTLINLTQLLERMQLPFKRMEKTVVGKAKVSG